MQLCCTITGPTGSGKSSLLKQIEELLESNGYILHRLHNSQDVIDKISKSNLPYHTVIWEWDDKMRRFP